MHRSYLAAQLFCCGKVVITMKLQNVFNNVVAAYTVALFLSDSHCHNVIMTHCGKAAKMRQYFWALKTML